MTHKYEECINIVCISTEPSHVMCQDVVLNASPSMESAVSCILGEGVVQSCMSEDIGCVRAETHRALGIISGQGPAVIP